MSSVGRRGAALPLLALALATLAYFGPSLVAGRHGFVGGLDVVLGHYWFKGYLAERVRAGELPLWNPWIYAGHPFLAYPEMGVFYPGSLLFVLLPLPWAFTLNAVLHVFLAAAGMFLFVRLLSGSRAGGVAAALCWAFGGYMLDRLNAGHVSYVQSAAVLPWVAWLLERALRSGRWLDFALAGAGFALLVLSAPPHNALYAALLLVVHAAAAGGARGPRAWLRRALQLALLFGFAALASAAQLVPTAELARLSDRGAGGSYEFATFLSYPPANLATLLVPHLRSPQVTLSAEFGGYVGVGGLLLAGLGLVQHRPRRAALGLGATALLALGLMLGRHTPAFGLLYQVLPGLALFRIPARAVFLLAFCLAALAGLGLAAARDPARGPRCVRALAMLALVAGAALVAVRGALLAGAASPELVRAGLLLLASAAAVLAAARAPGARGALVALAVLGADLAVNERWLVPRTDADELEAPRPAERVFAADPGLYRVALAFAGDRGMLGKFQNVDAFAPLAVGRYYRLVHALAGAPVDPLRRDRLHPQVFDRPHAFMGRLLNVKYTLTNANQMHVHAGDELLPRARLASAWRVEPDPERQLRLLAEGAIDLAREALLESAPAPAPPLPDAAGVAPGPPGASVTRYAPERIDVELRAPAPAILVLSELHYPGWSASLDGRPAPLLRADYAFRALAVPAGRHRVELSFRPASLALGALLSAGAWAALALAALRLRAAC